MTDINDDQNDDPIVAEVRRIREEIFASYNYDLNAYIKDMQRQTEEAARAGQKVASPPPRPEQAKPAPTKKAG